MSLDPQPRYSIPTHLTTPDKIDLPLFGVTVSLTMRQGVCFLLGGSIVFHLWQASLGLVGVVGLIVHWGGPFFLAFATYVLAVHEIRDRHLEDWMIVCWHYWNRPKVFVWCRVPIESMLAPSSEETHEIGQHDLDDEENDER